ncbi:hypothetical protein ACIQJX_33470 [Streptomyces griseoviridis]|nr:hypothetical protein [Streptomyces griseoviridis]
MNAAAPLVLAAVMAAPLVLAGAARATPRVTRAESAGSPVVAPAP